MTKIVLVIEDGGISAVFADGEKVELAVIDLDCEGFGRVAQIPQLDGTSEPALISRPKVEVDPAHVDNLFRIVADAEQEFAAGNSSPSI